MNEERSSETLPYLMERSQCPSIESVKELVSTLSPFSLKNIIPVISGITAFPV
ncbi:hypothetical protein [Bifidobacterium asteroides]|uniref:hypothetical protein n=1 Tax=Bifidobacterium TaxID=1678 RepID=UPI0015E8D9E2|nr:hypothetical protein [Bifidobacterium asteroides]